MIGDYQQLPIPAIRFGSGVHSALADLAAGFGTRWALVSGRGSFDQLCARHDALVQLAGSAVWHGRISEEPTGDAIDAWCTELRGGDIQAVIAIGGGSVLDAGKALAAMLPNDLRCRDVCEGVGDVPYDGRCLPVIAVPTTAGTGAEATRNAVLGFPGERPQKKSLRHDALTPRHAIVDPALQVGCPPAITAASGLDAVTQLIESLLAPSCTPLIASWCRLVLPGAARALPTLTIDGEDGVQLRAQMAHAALISGIALGNTGLGVVHGLAPHLGARFGIPHGAACGALLPASMAVTVTALRARSPRDPALDELAWIGRVLADDQQLDADEAIAAVPRILGEWLTAMPVERLATHGVSVEAMRDACTAKANRKHPIALRDEEVVAVVERSL